MEDSVYTHLIQTQESIVAQINKLKESLDLINKVIAIHKPVEKVAKIADVVQKMDTVQKAAAVSVSFKEAYPLDITTTMRKPTNKEGTTSRDEVYAIIKKLGGATLQEIIDQLPPDIKNPLKAVRNHTFRLKEKNLISYDIKTRQYLIVQQKA